MKYEPSMHKLSNGVTVILDPSGSAITAVRILFRTGCCDENPNQYGLTHFCEHMLNKGTKRLPTADAIEKFLMDNSAAKNASTGDRHIGLHGHSIAETAPLLIETLCDMLQNPRFDEVALETERGVILDELRRSLNNANEQTSNNVYTTIFGNKNIVYRALGTEENIKSFTRKQMKMWLARRLSAKNCVVCISGGIADKDVMLQLLEDKLAFLKPIDVENKKDTFKYKADIVHARKSNNTQIELTVGIPEFHEFNAKNLWARRCTKLYAKFIRDELYRVLRTENGLVYDIRMGQKGPNELTLNTFETTATPENLERVVGLMARTMRDIYDGKIQITDEYIRRHNAACKLGDAEWLNSPKDRCYRILWHYVDHDELYDFNKIIAESNNTTARDVIRFSRHFFDKPVSFITAGADYDKEKLRCVWNQNFGALPSMQLQTMMAEQKTK